MKYVMFYESADDYLPKARRYGADHRARLEQFHARGLLLAAGPLLDPQDGSAMGVFTSRQAAEEFVSGDRSCCTAWSAAGGSAHGMSSSPA